MSSFLWVRSTGIAQLPLCSRSHQTAAQVLDWFGGLNREWSSKLILISGRIHFLVVGWLRTLGSYCQLEAAHSSQTCLWAVHSMWNFFFQFTKMESDVANHHTVSPLANSSVPRTIALWFTKISIIFSRHTTFIGMLYVFSEIICLVIKVPYLYPGWVAKLVGASSRIWNKFSDFVPSQGPCLGCRFNPQLRCLQETNW